MHHPIITRAILAILPIAFVVIGLKVLISKKPAIINYRWFSLLVLIVIVAPIFDGTFALDNPLSYFPIVLFMVILGFVYYIMKGYMVVGADGDDFQRAFIDCLKARNYEYEQTFTSIKIKEPLLEISIAFQSWIGGGQIRLRSKENKETFDEIIHDLRTKDIKPNLIIPAFYLIIGVLILCMDFFRFKH